MALRTNRPQNTFRDEPSFLLDRRFRIVESFASFQIFLSSRVPLTDWINLVHRRLVLIMDDLFSTSLGWPAVCTPIDLKLQVLRLRRTSMFACTPGQVICTACSLHRALGVSQ
jgi:hypothetical protein